MPEDMRGSPDRTRFRMGLGYPRLSASARGESRASDEMARALTRRQVPNAQRFVQRHRGGAAAVGQEGGAGDLARVLGTGIRLDQLAREYLVDAHRLVLAARQRQPAVGREGDAPDGV